MSNEVVEEDVRTILAHDLPWDRLEGQTILITGASGCLPAYMVETILYLNEARFARPAKVIGLVRNRARAERRFAAYSQRSDLSFLVQDVCHPIVIEESVHFIIHAASQASPKYFGKDPAGTLCANVVGTLNLLQLAREHPIEAFLFFSSSEVYGQLENRQSPITEECSGYLDPTDVRSCYAESKRLGETMCVAWHEQYGIPTKIVRPFHTYGPGMSLDDGRVYADFVADIVRERDIVMNSDGRSLRAFCYLGDAVAGFFTVLFNGATGQAYNIGNRQGESTILNLAHTLVNLFPQKKLRIIRRGKPAEKEYLMSPVYRNCPDTTKAQLLGWEATTSIREGFTRTIRSFE